MRVVITDSQNDVVEAMDELHDDAVGAGGVPDRVGDPLLGNPVESQLRLGSEAGGRIEGSRLTASRPGVAPRRPAAPPAGVVVVRHKRVRTIVKPEDEQ